MITPSFSLEQFMKGLPVKTKDGRIARFYALLPEGDNAPPARLVIGVKPTRLDNLRQLGGAVSDEEAGLRMESYYIDGKYYPDVKSSLDLVMANIL